MRTVSKPKYNLVVLDMADLTPRERCLLRLNGNHGLSRHTLAEVFNLEPCRVARVLQRAKRKYEVCSLWLGVD